MRRTPGRAVCALPIRDSPTAMSTKPRRTAGQRLRRLAGFSAAAAVAAYLGVCVFIYLTQARLIYFPSPDYAHTPGDLHLFYEEHVLTAADGTRIIAWFLPHAEARATVLFLHGNGDNLGDLVFTARALQMLALDVLMVEYRGYGHSEGKPSEDGLYRDADAGWRWLVDARGVNPQRIVVHGRSLGGAVAIDLARRRPVGGLVVESSFSSLVAIGQRQYPLLPVSLIARHRFESIRKVPEIAAPKLFFHGRDDGLIPLSDGQRLYEAAAVPKQLVVTPGGHNSAGFEYDTAAQDRYAAWLAERFPGPTTAAAPD